MSRLARAWDRLWFAPHDTLAAGVFRIALGALMLVYLVAMYPSWDRFFAADGVLSLNVMDPARERVDVWTLFHVTDGRLPPIVFAWVGLAAAACFTLGWMTRASTIVLFVLFASIVHRNRWIVNGEDLVFRMLLFYGCFAPLGRSLSIDSWRRPPASREAPVWPLRLMQLNILAVYVISLPNKLVDDVAWWDGSALYLTMCSLQWARWEGVVPAFYAFGGLLSKTLTYGTVLVEGAFPILVWFRRTRIPAILAIASLHAGIAIALQNVTFFTLSMICSMWLFVPSESIRQAAARLRGDASAAPAVSGPRDDT